MSDLEGLSSSSLPICGLPHLYFTLFPRYYHTYSVREWLWPWEVF